MTESTEPAKKRWTVRTASGQVHTIIAEEWSRGVGLHRFTSGGGVVAIFATADVLSVVDAAAVSR